MINLEEAINIVEHSHKGMKVMNAYDHKSYFSFGLAPIDWDGDDMTLPVTSAAYCVNKSNGEEFEKHIVDLMLQDDMGKEIDLSCFDFT